MMPGPGLVIWKAWVLVSVIGTLPKANGLAARHRDVRPPA
jgi:hypothetical protein